MAKKWLKWEEHPELQRHDSVWQLVDRIFRHALEGKTFLSKVLPDLVSEFSLQWAGLLEKKPDWRVLAEFGRRPEVVPYRDCEEALDREAASQNGGTIIVPLRVVSLPTQSLVLQSKNTTEQLSHAVAVGNALGMGIEFNHRMSDCESKVERLRQTLNVVSAFGNVHETEPLLDLMAKAACQLLHCDRASIFIWDRPAKQVVACPALGVEGGVLRLPDDAGIVGEVIQTGRTIQVEDAYSDARFNKQVDQKSGYKTNNLLCVPVLDANKERIGAFEAINKHHRSFDITDAETLQELGNHAAIALNNTREREQLTRRHQQLTEQITQGVRIIGESPAIEAIRNTIERLAKIDLPVLILGESGTGKEVIAQALHYRGDRRDQPFVAVNCAALPESLLESELFGHERGAFTDAQSSRQGKFELAIGGTLFLDEIGEMSLGGQAKLLRVLEQKVITRVGGSVPIQTNVRIVAATNIRLQEAVREKKFREDLFYRLSVVTIDLPPLRDRPQDILLLADFFLTQFCRQARRTGMNLSPESRRRLQSHNWPGNVRELRNLMERVAFLCSNDRVETDDLAFILSPEPVASAEPSDDQGLSEATDFFQAEFIRRAIKRANGNMSQAANRLGLHRSNLYRKMRLLGMEVTE